MQNEIYFSVAPFKFMDAIRHHFLLYTIIKKKITTTQEFSVSIILSYGLNRTK